MFHLNESVANQRSTQPYVVNTLPKHHTVLTSPVRVHRLREADVGRVVAADDAARDFLGHHGLGTHGGLAVGIERAPAIVYLDGGGDREAAGHVGGGAAPLDDRTRAADIALSCRARAGERVLLHAVSILTNEAWCKQRVPVRGASTTATTRCRAQSQRGNGESGNGKRKRESNSNSNSRKRRRCDSPFPIPDSLIPAVKRLRRLKQNPAGGNELVAADRAVAAVGVGEGGGSDQ